MNSLTLKQFINYNEIMIYLVKETEDMECSNQDKKYICKQLLDKTNTSEKDKTEIIVFIGEYYE